MLSVLAGLLALSTFFNLALYCLYREQAGYITAIDRDKEASRNDVRRLTEALCRANGQVVSLEDGTPVAIITRKAPPPYWQSAPLTMPVTINGKPA